MRRAGTLSPVVAKILYTPLSIGLGIGAGIVARKTFDVVWDKIDGPENDGPPNAGDQGSPIGKVVLAAALQATTFAVTKTVVDRQGRRFYYHLTGFWPGDAATSLPAGDPDA